MRKIVTAVTAASLALSMLAMAVPASAVTGYDSAYAGESAFVNISPGQTQNFQVFFANTGTTTWSRGTGTQVDLAACLSNKTTCNAVEASNASWNSGWLSSSRYATTTQTTTAPGSLGTFSYNVTAPVGAAAGTYRFNGDLVLSTTGEKIHPEGYYQDATIGTGGGGAATLTSLSPFTGTSNGGDSVTIKGTGFVCTPAFPAVSFGGTNAVVTSCGSTQVVSASPAHAPGAVTVTVTNSGTAASNGLTFTYIDTTPPQFTGVAVAANVVTVTYSKKTCKTTAANAGTDWTVRNVSAAAPVGVLSDNTPTCTSATDTSNGATTANLVLSTSPSIPPGAFVEVALNATNPPATAPACQNATSCNTHFLDAAANTIMAPQAQTATATNPSSNPPSIVSASGAVGASKVTINFSQPVWCDASAPAGFAPSNFKLNSFQAGVTDPTFTATDASNKCGGAQTATGTPLVLNTSSALPANTTYTLTFTQPAGTTGAVKNVYNVALPTGSSVTFTTGAADITPPVIVDARITNKVGPSSDFMNITDAFALTFNKKMTSPPAAGATISVQDQDGTTATITCGTGATCAFDSSTSTVLTVTLTATLASTGGTTPGLAIPFNITATTGITDASGNVPNILGSPDRLVRYR
jgi:hypothetical protein